MNAKCPHCDCTDETEIHILRKCQATKRVWKEISPINELVPLKLLTDKRWIQENLIISQTIN